jgi:hypothetical protein
MLGLVCRRICRYFWQSNSLETSWLKDFRMEQILRLFSHWGKFTTIQAIFVLFCLTLWLLYALIDEKHFYRRVKEVWEAGARPLVDQTSHVIAVGICPLAQIDQSSHSSQTTHEWLQASTFRRYCSRFWEFTLRRRIYCIVTFNNKNYCRNYHPNLLHA